MYFKLINLIIFFALFLFISFAVLEMFGEYFWLIFNFLFLHHRLFNLQKVC